jgi:hypothetical protein
MAKNIDRWTQDPNWQSLFRPLDPAEFVRIGGPLLEQMSETFLVYNSEETEEERFEAQTAKEVLLRMADIALTNVHLEVQGQEQAADHVKMIQTSGNTPERLWNFWSAERVSTNYHLIKNQLEKAPHSPVLSVFVNEYHLDPHHGVIVRGAHTDGSLGWRSDPFRNEGGKPEAVLGIHDWPGPIDGWVGSPSRSREQAILDAHYRGSGSSVLDRTDNELTIVADDWCTLLTDDHNPQHLILPENGEEGQDYYYWLRDVIGLEARMNSGTHLLAIGEEAVDRLVMRFQQELVPFLCESSAGVLEARRIFYHMNSALAAVNGRGEAISFGPNHNIKLDVSRHLSEQLTAHLARHGIYSDKYFPSILIQECREANIPLDLDFFAPQILYAIADHHVSDLISLDELQTAIQEEVTNHLTL